MCAAAIAGAAGCGRAGPASLTVTLDVPEQQPSGAVLTVAGIPSRYLPGHDELTAERWPEVLRVTVVSDDEDGSRPANSDLPAVAGSYSISRGSIVFKPLFGFTPGLRYRAVFDASRLPSREDWKPEPVVAVVQIPKQQVAPTTFVDYVYPTRQTVPENQLRLYLHFSAPMGRKGGIEHVRLLDADGREVEQPFLPIDAEFWNPDRTRFTVFFDPGRVKRGILPNRKLGRPLKAGRQYTLVVDHEWRDGAGLPLKETFQRTFRAGPADMRPLDPARWRFKEPGAGSREPLTVTFPEPLDHGLLMRALGVSTTSGRALSGDVRIEAEETQWSFTPSEAWPAGDYHLVVLTILEDLAGNRIGRAFEIDQFEQVDQQATEEERVTVPFRVGQK
jgi:hypothetical protein